MKEDKIIDSNLLYSGAARTYINRHLTQPLITLPQPSTMTTPLSLDEEVRLYSTNAERDKYNTLATLYGIIVALDYLERAYVRDSITAAE